MFAAVVFYVYFCVLGIKMLCFQVADFIGLWVIIKTESTDRSALASSIRASGSAGSGSASGSFGSASGSKSKRSGGRGAADGGVTARMRSQDLMHAFLEQNRPWMLQNLANIFTSEF